MNPLIIIGGGVLLIAVVLLLLFSGPSTKKIQKRRIADVRARHGAAYRRSVEGQLRRITGREDTQMDKLATRLLPRADAIQKRLERTGKKWSQGQYLVSCGVIFVIVALPVYLKFGSLLIAVGIAAIIGWFVPKLAVAFLIKRRVKNFTAMFPNAIELLVRGLRSGLPISETIEVVAVEMDDPISIEFRSVSDKIKIGRTMESALLDTAERLDIPEFKFFTIALSIQRETGGNLAETLSNLARVLRDRAQMKLKIAAMSSEAKASAYIIGALPFIVFTAIFYVSPSYMDGFFVDTRLMIAAGIGATLMAMGAFTMYKMINFDI